MNYCQIIKDDIANGPGIRLTLFVSGCTNKCPGCFQPDTWDFDYGKKFTDDVMQALIYEYNKPQYNGFTFLGGDPLHPKNLETVRDIVLELRKQHTLAYKDIWLYTGYKFEDLMEKAYHDWDLATILERVDIVVDGPFVLDQKISPSESLRNPFRGSLNQRFIKSKESISKGSIIENTNYYDIKRKE